MLNYRGRRGHHHGLDHDFLSQLRLSQLQLSQLRKREMSALLSKRMLAIKITSGGTLTTGINYREPETRYTYVRNNEAK